VYFRKFELWEIRIAKRRELRLETSTSLLMAQLNAVLHLHCITEYSVDLILWKYNLDPLY